MSEYHFNFSLITYSPPGHTYKGAQNPMFAFALFPFYLPTFVSPAPISLFPVFFAEYTLIFVKTGQSVKTQGGL
jgi:hypothetical protein